MLQTERVNAIFADARLLYDDALEQLEAGKLCNAAEKAWGATKRATDALILARTGEEPRTSSHTMQGIRALRHEDPSIESLRLRYAARQSLPARGLFLRRHHPSRKRTWLPTYVRR